jgi:AcrR family transcriptional regulator
MDKTLSSMPQMTSQQPQTMSQQPQTTLQQILAPEQLPPPPSPEQTTWPKRRSQKRKNRSALTRDAWITGALMALAEEGHTGLYIETLSKRLRVTKGSFYWHFKDRLDLVEAVLQEWKRGRIIDICKHTTINPGEELAAFQRTIDVYSNARNTKGLAIELAMREWANRDPHVAATVAEVDMERTRCTAQLFEKLGIPPAEATIRGIVLHACIFGFSLLRCGNLMPDVQLAKEWMANRIIR